MAVLRAFTYFSHLANIAEDRHYIAEDGTISGAVLFVEWSNRGPATWQPCRGLRAPGRSRLCSGLSVHDEIENALGYYHTTFLRQIPQLYAELEEQLGAIDVASFFRMAPG
jgi:phosphoenolpyruvate carboxylase